ncbi:hypothetical protein M0R04_04835 [Candidatus Dojkabacteria bacterium]|jgi:hypothetical protein|nr:hypothetical protein [Candidatus Dojkabacteria bacterium]
MKNVKAEVVKVKRINANKIIDEQVGKFFTAIFASKVDGRECKINGRQLVKKYLKKVNTSAAVTSGVDTNHPDLKTTFNVKKLQYRKIHLDGIREIRASNKIYSFE